MAREKCEGNSLGTLVDEAELAEQADETAVLELAHELVFETVDTAITLCASMGVLALRAFAIHLCASSSSVSKRLPIMSNSWPMFW